MGKGREEGKEDKQREEAKIMRNDIGIKSNRNEIKS